VKHLPFKSNKKKKKKKKKKSSWHTRTVDQSATMMDRKTDAKFGLFCLFLTF